MMQVRVQCTTDGPHFLSFPNTTIKAKMPMGRLRDRAENVLARLSQRADSDAGSPSCRRDPALSNEVSLGSVACVYREKSSFPVVATSSKHTSSDCVSSTALMVYRGIGAGVAWTVGVDLYALVGASDRAWREHLESLGRPSTKTREFTRLLVRSCGRNVLLFGGFLTVFGGLTCSMEMVRGRHDFVNPFVGGFASGLVIMPRDMYKTPKLLVGGAALCGAAAMALYQFIPASSEGADWREAVATVDTR